MNPPLLAEMFLIFIFFLTGVGFRLDTIYFDKHVIFQHILTKKYRKISGGTTTIGPQTLFVGTSRLSPGGFASCLGITLMSFPGGFASCLGITLMSFPGGFCLLP